MLEILATLIHTPEDNFHKVPDIFLPLLKSRFLRARKMPSSQVKEDGEGGYFVRTAKKRMHLLEKANIYSVYRTHFGIWICTCYDFALEQMPCKHIIRVILYRNGYTDEKNRMTKLLQAILESNREGRIYKYK